MEIGARIRERREALGLRQQELAERCGVKSKTIISNWEHGISKPDVERLPLLCKALSTSVNWLLDDYSFTETHSADEDQLLRKFRQLDERGVYELNRFLEMQLDVIRSYEHISLAPAHDGTSTRNIFLTESSPIYADMRQRCKELKRIKAKARKSYLSITQALWHNGYGDTICLAYVISVFSGERVPDEQLYDDILRALNS